MPGKVSKGKAGTKISNPPTTNQVNIPPSTPPSPKLLDESVQLARIANYLARAARNTAFSKAQRAAFVMHANTYFISALDWRNRQVGE